MSALDLISVLLLVALVGVAGAVALLALASSRPLLAYLGFFLVIAAGALPLGLAYGFGAGLLGLVLGGGAVAVWRGRSSSWPKRGLLAVAAVWLVVEPLLLLNAFQIRAEETFSRCASEKAVVLVEASRRRGEGYPASVADIAAQDDSFGRGGCSVGNGVNWLYRVNIGGSYFIGYWVDWHVTRRVCIERVGDGATGWSCGFEDWGPFRPGETD